MKTEEYALTEDELKFKCDLYAEEKAKQVIEKLESFLTLADPIEKFIIIRDINIIKSYFTF